MIVVVVLAVAALHLGKQKISNRCSKVSSYHNQFKRRAVAGGGGNETDEPQKNSVVKGRGS